MAVHLSTEGFGCAGVLGRLWQACLLDMGLSRQENVMHEDACDQMGHV